MTDYDAILFLSFGGPEGPEDVIPFLENVLRGRNVPRARMLEVAEHYQNFGGISPINAQNRALISALEAELAAHNVNLPVYFGNRNWHPLLTDTLRQMQQDGVRRAITFVTSAFSTYSGCRQYREDIIRAQETLSSDSAAGSDALQLDKLRVYYNHPGFLQPMVDNTLTALTELPAERRNDARLLFTAHSIPNSMAAGCRYESQLQEACRLIAEQVGSQPWELVYQSRSGAPHVPWLEPDVCDRIEQLHSEGQLNDVVLIPIGFISDHMEVMFDLDIEAAQLCERLGVGMQRAATVGTDPRFVQMIRLLVEERMADVPDRLCWGDHGPSHDVCPEDCCLLGAAPGRPPRPAN